MNILLNCLPPVDINSPSISLSILKKFMENNGRPTQIKYWNFSLSLMSDYYESEDTEIRLLPFLSILNDKHKNSKGNKRILSLLQKLQPSFKINHPDYYSKWIEDQKKEIFKTIRKEIKEIDFSKILLFGISAKYNQWIPGMILAEEIKKIAPQVKIVVGGFGSKDVAKEAMNLCAHFDFTTWGEGEYSLLELSEQLMKNSTDFSLVPRLIYRKEKELVLSETIKSEYLDFENYIFPDYQDYMDQYPDKEEMDKINMPINTMRSCSWSKCKFCDFNKGYKLRIRTPECIVNELEHLTNKFGLTTFSFVDSDTFGSFEHFEELLDLIIDLRFRNEVDYVFWAEIIPNIQFTANMMEKMAIAGFKNIFIGYDGLSDSMLKKMNKSNSFSDNIFFVKHSLKNGISPIVNVIKHVPGESEEDVQECIDNLHYLRFFYNNSIHKFEHIYVNLVLSSMTKYYRVMPDDERKKYNIDELTYLMPEHFSNHENRFHLFRFEKETKSNLEEWEKIKEIENYYKSNSFTFKIQENNGTLYYTEYCNDTEIENIVFGEKEYASLLKIMEEQVYSFSEVFSQIKEIYPEISEGKVKQVLRNLKESYLVYFGDDFSNIVSVVNMNK